MMGLFKASSIFPSSIDSPHPIPLPPWGRGEGEGAIVKALNGFVISLTAGILMSKGEGVGEKN
jgi:hypothetical protein